MSQQKKVGVISIQGDYAKHLESLSRIDVPGFEVRTPEDLAGCTHLIIPGGESTTVGLLMQKYGLGPALKNRIAAGIPIWGTCMGMILLARRIEDREQYTLGALDITVRRNAFGAQVHSFESPVSVSGMDGEVLGVFIRAPIVTEVGAEVEVLSRFDNQIVAVRSGCVLGTSFHPELTPDTRLHEWFVSL